MITNIEVTFARCTKCKKIRDLFEFSPNKRKLNGASSACRKCNNHVKNNQYHRDIVRARQMRQEWSRNNPLKKWAYDTRSRHKGRGFQFLVDPLELVARLKRNNFCPLCNSEYIIQKGQSPFNASLDRINNTQDMTNENVMIICQRCNMSKSNRTLKEFIAYCELVVSKKKELLEIVYGC